MIEETGRVVALAEDFAWVETERKTTCGSCSANKGCGTAVLANAMGRRRTQVKVLNSLSARVGDEVVIGLEEHALVQGSLAVYAVPVIFLLGFALLGELIGARLDMTTTEMLNIVFGLGGLTLGFVWVRGYAARISKDPRYQPVILRPAASRLICSSIASVPLTAKL